MMIALIFGITGQDGFYLEQLCKKKGINVVGVSRNKEYGGVDIANFQQVEELVKRMQPDYIFHLAANSTTRHNALWENHATISTGTLNILESVYQHSKHTKVFITGSGVQFKNGGNPISEDTDFDANSPYSIVRIQSVYAARYYRSLGIKTYVGYLFHHESPLRKPNHISKKIVDAVKRIVNGSKELIELGDISVEKEWTFAGDIVNAIDILINQDVVYEAVIGSGIVYSIKDWLKECFAIYQLDWSKYVTTKPVFIAEYKKLVSNPTVIKSLGWTPNVDFLHLAQMMLK